MPQAEEAPGRRCRDAIQQGPFMCPTSCESIGAEHFVQGQCEALFFDTLPRRVESPVFSLNHPRYPIMAARIQPEEHHTRQTSY